MRKQNLVRRRASSGEDPNNGYLNTAYCTSGCWFNWLRFHSCRVDNRILQYGYKSSLIPEWSSRFMRGKSRNHCLTGKTKGGKRLLNPLTLKPRERKWAKPVGCKLIRPIGNQKARLRDRRPGLSPRGSLWKRTSTTLRPSPRFLFLPGASYTEGWLIPANENFPAKELHHTGERRSLIAIGDFRLLSTTKRMENKGRCQAWLQHE